jgi:SAM-dependent methyltransferase
MNERPIPESYWVLPGRFLAGEYPGLRFDEFGARQRLTAFLNAGFDSFIDLTGIGERPPYLPMLQEEARGYNADVSHLQFSFPDFHIPTPEAMTAALDAIDAALAEGHKVYLHCVGGIGRTGTTVGCWLIRHGMKPAEALARLRALYATSAQSALAPRSPEADEQVEFILNWKEPSPLPPLPPSGGLPKKVEENKIDWHSRFLQQASWTRDLRAYLFERAGLERTQRVLEVGCGTGAVLAGLATPAIIHGLDRDAARLAEARLHAPSARLVRGDALELPYPAGTFEITFCHFLLLWVHDPLQALLEMKRVTRPGGYVLALAEPDYENRVDKPDSLVPLGRWQTESLRRQGADPGLGRRAAELFRQAGIRLIETGPLREGGKRPLSPAEWGLEWAVLEADLAGRVPAHDLRRMKQLDEEAWNRGDRLLHVPTYFAWGQV